MTPPQEFTAWMTRNAPILRLRSSDEIAYMAKVCGFSIDAICEGLSDGFMNLKTRTTFKQRSDWFVGRELKQADVHCGKHNLEEQWHHLARKIVFGKDFDD